MTYSRIANASYHIGAGAVILLGASLFVSTAADTALVALAAACWFIEGRFREKVSRVVKHPVSIAALLLFAFYAAGAAYSTAGRADILASLEDALIFLMIPLFMHYFRHASHRRCGLWAFGGTSAAILVLSTLLWCDCLPHFSFIKGTPEDAVIFTLHITHGVVMAFAAYYFAVIAHRPSSLLARTGLRCLSILAFFNVFFMVSGRTGYLVAAVLIVFYLFHVARWKGVAAAAVIIAVIGGAAYVVPDSALHLRMTAAFENITQWSPYEEYEGTDNSTGRRLSYYYTSLRIVKDHPLFGVGTGGFKKTYAAATPYNATDNPHNEYLMTAVQLGLVGLAVFLFLFLVEWRCASSLPDDRYRMLARGFILTILSASMVSSTLIDHTEGHLFAWLSALLYADLA